MRTIGLLKDKRGFKHTTLTPDDIKSFNNEVSFIIESGVGLSNGYSDSDYEVIGALVMSDQKEIIKYSEIVIIHDEINKSIDSNEEKLFLTDVNYFEQFASLITMTGSRISLFSFADENLRSCSIAKVRNIKSYYLGFLKFYLGDPVSVDLINSISLSKVLEKGKIVNRGIINQIEEI